jgi:hypothetical protein
MSSGHSISPRFSSLCFFHSSRVRIEDFRMSIFCFYRKY